MRVVSGKYKRRRFDVPKTFKARPTTDFAKENLFNVLSNYIDFEDGVKALDLFAGTGSITIELLSRGCDRVVSVEKDGAHHAFIKKVLAELGDKNCILLRDDVFRYLGKTSESFDFIFADPPYALPELKDIPDIVMGSETLLADGVLFVLEHGKDHSFDTHEYFLERRVYGSVNFSFFSKQRTEEADE